MTLLFYVSFLISFIQISNSYPYLCGLFYFMCTSPYFIKNTNISSRRISDWIKKRDPTYVSKNINLHLKDTTFQFIRVPCGHCPSCLALRQSYFVQRCQMESLDNDLYFGTLTYSNYTIPRININGYNITYADIKDVQNMFKRIRKNYNLPKFRYLVVSEFGGKKHRPHFHFLLSVPSSERASVAEKVSLSLKFHDIFLMEWRRNTGSTRKPIYIPLCNYVCNSRGRNFDLHYVNPSLSSNGCSDVAFYVSKYMMKHDKYVDALKSALYYNIPDYDTFVDVWKKVRPRCLISKGFGNPNSEKVKEHIRKSIDFGINSTSYDFPIYVNPITSQTFPLSPYYKKKFFTLLDSYGFLYKQDCFLSDGSFMPEDYDPIEIYKSYHLFSKKQSKILEHDSYNYDVSDLSDCDFESFVDDYLNESISINKLNINDYESNEF